MLTDCFICIIDSSPIDQQFKTYFHQFNTTVIQQTTIHSLPQKLQALVIDWTMIKNNPEIITILYNHYPCPLIITHDMPDTTLCIRALEQGADDFIVKPFNPKELHAKIQAITRRILNNNPTSYQGKAMLSFGHWRMQPASRQLFNLENQEVTLSTGEYDLLRAFIQSPCTILHREFLARVIKGKTLAPLDRKIDIQVSRLRQKIEINAKKPMLIKTVRNGGYMLTSEVILETVNNSP